MAEKDTPVAPQPLTNSQRRLYKATYRPLTVPPKEQQQTGRFWEKLAFLRGLDIQPQEFVQLESSATMQAQPSPLADKVPLVEIMKGLAANLSFATMRRYGPSLAKTSPEELIKISNALHEIRIALVADTRQKLCYLQDRFQEAVHVFLHQGEQKVPSAPETSIEAAVEWARTELIPEYEELRNIAANLRFPSTATVVQTVTGTELMEISPAEISSLPQRLDQRVSLTASLADALQYQMQIKPVGQLHLERIEMTPAGIEHGELVHSIPLTPNETVNITHREWSVTTSTFENIIQDSFEGFSETGVAEKTDLSHATDNEAKHSSALDVSGSVSASYNGGAYSVTASTAVDYRQQTDTQQIEKDSVAHSLGITRNASTRTKKDHKISFRVSSVAGAEDLAVRVITNPSDTNAMRVDYFQLLRKWRVDLIRYGIRMTYDLVIPNPGLDLIGRTLEIQSIDEMLTTASYSFRLHIDDIKPDSNVWLSLSEQYGVELPPPPTPSLPIAYYKKLDPAHGDGLTTGEVEIEIPEGYEFDDGSFYAEAHLQVTSGVPRPFFAALHQHVGPKTDADDPYNVSLTVPLKPLFQGTAGKIMITYSYQNTSDGFITVTGTSKVVQKTIDQWQLNSWTALRNADQAAYDKRIEQAKERKAFLQDQIAQFDALTLRKMEREEIMRWVLRWLLGPSFDLMPANLKDLFRGYPDPGTISNPIKVGIQSVTPSSMAGITYGTRLVIDSGSAQETVTVIATTATTFTASFINTHAAGAVIQIDPPSQYAYPDVSKLGYDLYCLPSKKEECVTAWQAIINHGEFIKYIHEAIEWENVLFFAYPYFWDTVKNWPFKQYLMHPDPIHREFLRSGAMRVVLTIRPGFEDSFAMLQQTGDSTAPPDTSFPYVTIAEDIRNFAMTNYQGIPPANPDNNVRPLLYPEQRKAWNDMQKLIQLIEDYNNNKHNRTISDAIPIGTQTVTPSSMEGIAYGIKLIIDSNENQETVTVKFTESTTFTADFTKTHAAGVAIQIDQAVKMYPITRDFPDAIEAFAGTKDLPLTDPWGNPYDYISPGLNADYDLVCYGKDGIADQDQTDEQRSDPLNKNITNYAEGSVVGRWYEYTPTGALDVAINTVLPTIPRPA